MITAYKSNFLKADSRAQETPLAYSSYQSANNDKISVTDIFLPAGSGRTITLSADDLHILFPIVGALHVDGISHQFTPENLFCYCAADPLELDITNPFPDEVINFLHISIDRAAHKVSPSGISVARLQLDRKNRLISAEGAASCIRVGVYDSRVKDKTTLSRDHDGLFTFIINGSFDFEERLMEYRDALYQWDTREVDFEALSETAILLLIECSLLK